MESIIGVFPAASTSKREDTAVFSEESSGNGINPLHLGSAVVEISPRCVGSDGSTR